MAVKNIVLASAALVSALSSSIASAQDGEIARPQFGCGNGSQCDSALWGLNKQGYALIASLSMPKTYQICMGTMPTNPTSWFSVYIKVDNVITNYGSGIGAPLVSGGCTVVTGKKIELFNTGAAPIKRIQGHYRRLYESKGLTLGYNWLANPTGSVSVAGSPSPIYDSLPVAFGRVCFGGGDASAQAMWGNQRNLVVGKKHLTRSDGTTTAVFGRNTCVDVEGTGIFVWRDFDATETYPVGGAFYFAQP